MKELRIGLIGFGFIGKIHTLAYQNLLMSIKNPKIKPKLVALLRSPLTAPGDGLASSIFETVTTNPDQFFDQDMDLIDICTPNHLHFSQVERSLKSVRAVYCEKPLAMTYPESLKLAHMAESLHAITQVAYMMRFSPAIRQIKRLLADGLIGDLYHYRAFKYHASYLDTQRPISWRLRFDQSGGGAFTDLGSHLVDLSRYLFGPPQQIRAQMRTYIHQRPEKPGSDQLLEVDVDDWAQCVLDYGTGGMGEIEVSRVAAGSGELTGIDIFGSKGSISYKSTNPEISTYYDLNQKAWNISETFPAPIGQERMIADIWPEKKFSQGDMVNRHMAAIYDLLLNISENKPCLVDFKEAAKSEEIVDATYRSARDSGSWIRINNRD
jgi:predicted dehydrogenase